VTASFKTVSEFEALVSSGPKPDDAAMDAARARDAQLTKPAGSLGRMEDLAIWVAGWQGNPRPMIAQPHVIVFAGNHGVASEGVSAFPAEVTAQMVANFEHGGASINQLCRANGAGLQIVPIELDRPTQPFNKAPAMGEDELLAALKVGWEAVPETADILIFGEMGIGNTTSAAAIAAALLGGDPADWVGRGTGVDDAGLKVKADVIAAGLALHGASQGGMSALGCFGGREIAAIAGAIVRARALKIPVILDGFIATSAALALHAISSDALDHCCAGHVSAEQAHHKMLAAIGKEPILALDMRLGEASGATVALSIVKAAVACHSGMATFAEASVSDG
jgi:nicotinate-nucleotide--dimethylbenzimidazole phosphoribosyltransferase